MILQGDCVSVLKTLPEASVNCVVTSPPYFSLRDYGVPPSVWGGDPAHPHIWAGIERQAERYTGKRKWQHIGEEAQAAGVKVRDVDPNAWGHPKQRDTAFCECGAWLGALGLEPTPELFVEHIVLVFREVRRVLRKDGTLWFNMGDSYAATGGCGLQGATSQRVGRTNIRAQQKAAPTRPPKGLKAKDLIGVPWMCAFALRAAGWYLRSDIIWSKNNPMPESIRDRPTKAHEYLFLFSKSNRYHYDADAISEPVSQSMLEQLKAGYDGEGQKDYLAAGVQNPSDVKRSILKRSGNKARKFGADRGCPEGSRSHQGSSVPWEGLTRNKRSVWTIPTAPFPEAHFATFPEDLVEPCIRAGCPEGGSVLDPFAGAGTVGVVCAKLQRRFTGIELNHSYIEMAERRISAVAPLFGEASA